jgi:hypothetical protein
MGRGHALREGCALREALARVRARSAAFEARHVEWRGGRLVAQTTTQCVRRRGLSPGHVFSLQAVSPLPVWLTRPCLGCPLRDERAASSTSQPQARRSASS